MYPTVLGLHIVVGSLAMATGPLALLWRLAGRGRHRLLVDGYLAAVLATAGTAAGMSLLKWSQFFWLLPVSALTAVLVLAGRRAAMQGGPAWVRAHGYGGSYIALVTALCVIAARGQSTLQEVLAWVAPAAIGVPVILASYHGETWSTRLHRLLIRTDRPGR